MNIGSLYQVKKRFWLVFPTKKIVAVAATVVDELMLAFRKFAAALLKYNWD